MSDNRTRKGSVVLFKSKDGDKHALHGILEFSHKEGDTWVDDEKFDFLLYQETSKNGNSYYRGPIYEPREQEAANSASQPDDDIPF